MRNFVAPFLVFTLVVCGSAQTKDSLNQRFGRPSSETYDSGKGLMLTTTFDGDGNLCSVLIDRRSKSGHTPSSVETVSDADAKRILDEIAPMEQRGQFVGGEFLDIICLPDNNCFGNSRVYQNLSITFIGNTDHYRYVYVDYKRAKCERRPVMGSSLYFSLPMLGYIAQR